MGVAGRMALCLLLAGPAAGQEAPAPRVRLDAQGDPLPPRALFRLGAARLRFKDSVQALAFSPDGRFLAARGVGDAHIELCDAHTGKIDRLFLLPEPGDGRLAFSPDSQWLAWLGQLHDKRPGMLRVWQVHTGRLHLSGDLSLPLTALAFAPDSRRLAGVRRNLVLQTWELPGGKELKASAPTPGLSGASLSSGDASSAGTSSKGRSCSRCRCPVINRARRHSQRTAGSWRSLTAVTSWSATRSPALRSRSFTGIRARSTPSPSPPTASDLSAAAATAPCAFGTSKPAGPC
jgi:hypothetical protein